MRSKLLFFSTIRRNSYHQSQSWNGSLRLRTGRGKLAGSRRDTLINYAYLLSLLDPTPLARLASLLWWNRAARRVIGNQYSYPTLETFLAWRKSDRDPSSAAKKLPLAKEEPSLPSSLPASPHYLLLPCFCAPLFHATPSWKSRGRFFETKKGDEKGVGMNFLFLSIWGGGGGEEIQFVRSSRNGDRGPKITKIDHCINFSSRNQGFIPDSFFFTRFFSLDRKRISFVQWPSFSPLGGESLTEGNLTPRRVSFLYDALRSYCVYPKGICAVKN